eukprot:316906-Prymnesium_polylepis.2
MVIVAARDQEPVPERCRQCVLERAVRREVNGAPGAVGGRVVGQQRPVEEMHVAAAIDLCARGLRRHTGGYGGRLGNSLPCGSGGGCRSNGPELGSAWITCSAPPPTAALFSVRLESSICTTAPDLTCIAPPIVTAWFKRKAERLIVTFASRPTISAPPDGAWQA